MARYTLSPALRSKAARCKLPFVLRPGLSQEDMKRAKEKTKERTKENETRPPLILFRGRHGGWRGEKQRLFLTLGTQLLGLHPSVPLPSLSPLSPLPPLSLTPHSLRLPQPGPVFPHPWCGEEAQYRLAALPGLQSIGAPPSGPNILAAYLITSQAPGSSAGMTMMMVMIH